MVILWERWRRIGRAVFEIIVVLDVYVGLVFIVTAVVIIIRYGIIRGGGDDSRKIKPDICACYSRRIIESEIANGC
jgi:hypothetical protein